MSTITMQNMDELVAFICSHYGCSEDVAKYDYISPAGKGALIDLDNKLVAVTFKEA